MIPPTTLPYSDDLIIYLGASPSLFRVSELYCQARSDYEINANLVYLQLNMVQICVYKLFWCWLLSKSIMHQHGLYCGRCRRAGIVVVGALHTLDVYDNNNYYCL